MLYCIYLLRVLGAILITNSHYGAIYPYSVIANGGLLGDVLFFAVSGFCLYPIRKSFPQWYGRRLKRIYPLVWIITAVYCLLGFYRADSILGFIKLFVYPTYYHFVASILLLYFVYYLTAKFLQSHEQNWNRMFWIVIAMLSIIYVALYVIIYDRSYYHIDNVREPMIEFLYFFAMMIGMFFRYHQDRFVGKQCSLEWFAAIGLFSVYFASKTAFSRGMIDSQLQLVNQIVLLLLLICLFRGFIGLEDSLEHAPVKFRNILKCVASFAFEIYLVQYSLIPRLNIGPFPVNFLIVSTGIIVSAMILHSAHKIIMASIANYKKTKTTWK